MVISLIESNFVRSTLLQQLRLDGRSLDHLREVNFEFSTVDRGHVIVHLGKTRVLACVSAQVTRPFPDRPLEGQFGIYVEVGQLALASEDLSAKEDEKLALTRLLERFFKNGRTVDTESLCILPGERVWSIRLDVHVLDHCGNVTDATCLAALAALLDFRRPDSTVIDGKAVIYSTFEKHPVPLTIQYHPISITFGTFELAEAVSSSQRDTKVELVVDPDYNEEAVVAGKITFAMNRQGEVISVIKTGGIGLDPEIIHTKCLNVASKHVQALSNQLDAALKFR